MGLPRIRPFSVASWFLVLNGAIWIAMAFADPFDPAYGARSCHFIAPRCIVQAMHSWLGPLGPRVLFLALGLGLLALLPVVRSKRGKVPRDAGTAP